MKTLKNVSFWMIVSLLAVSCSKKDDGTTDPPVNPPSGSLTVTAISPDYGKAGIEITITGTGFSTTASDDAVTIGDKTATVSSATTTQLKINAPANGIHGTVTVKVGTLAASGPTFYYEPEVTSLSTTTGKAGDAITITGKNFGTATADFEVKFNGVTAEITAATATTLSVKVPATATTGVITVARKTKTPVNGPSFTVTTAAVSTAFTVTDGSIAISNLLKYNTTTYGTVLCFTVDEANSILYAGTTTQLLKIDLATNAVTTLLTNSSFLANDSKPSAMDVGPDGKLYLLVDKVTIGGIPATGSNVYLINTSSNTATAIGNRYIGVNIGGSIADNIPFMVTANNEFIVMDGSVGTIVKYSADLSVRTVLLSVSGVESFSHLVKNSNNSIRIVTLGLTARSYYDYTTSLSAKTDYPAAIYTDLVNIARGGTSAYALKAKNASDASATSNHQVYTIGKLNSAQTDYEKKASFSIDKFYTVSTVKYYNSIPLNGKTYFYADKSGNMYALVLSVDANDDSGIYKFTVN